MTQRISSVSRSALGLRIRAASTGIRVSDSTSDPAIAKLILNAMGLNSLPSRPCRLNRGRNTTMIIRMAKAMGLATSRAAASTAAVRSTGSPFSPHSDMMRNAFSVITTAPSTIMPMPMAKPASDIRLADRPASPMKMKAMSMAIGSAAITTMAERNSPRNKNRTIATRMEPSISARSAVLTASSTSSVRSYTGLMTAPSGRVDAAISTFSFTASTTSAALVPMRDSAMPSTTSLPSRVTAPNRNPGACSMSATSRR